MSHYINEVPSSSSNRQNHKFSVVIGDCVSLCGCLVSLGRGKPQNRAILSFSPRLPASCILSPHQAAVAAGCSRLSTPRRARAEAAQHIPRALSARRFFPFISTGYETYKYLHLAWLGPTLRGRKCSAKQTGMPL
jgi:hypothetical protein